MASAEEALVRLLLDDADVAAIAKDRIRPALLEEGDELPAIVYFVVDEERPSGLSGSWGLAKARVQLSAWAGTYGEAWALGEAVRLRLQNYAGTVTVGAETVTFDGIFLLDRGDLAEPAPGEEQSRRYGKRLDFTVCTHELVP